MGIGGLIVRGALVAGLLYMGVTGISKVANVVKSNNAVVEPGYVNPKSLSVQSKKNSSGNIEAYLNYKTGDETVSLPVKKGPQGPLVGTVEYWWESIGASQREGLTVAEWPAISNSAKHDILSSELRVIIDTFYGITSTGRAQGLYQPGYQQPKQQK